MRVSKTKLQKEEPKEEIIDLFCHNCHHLKVSLRREPQRLNIIYVCTNKKCFHYTDIDKIKHVWIVN